MSGINGHETRGVSAAWIVMVYLSHEWLIGSSDISGFPRGSSSMNGHVLSLTLKVMSFVWYKYSWKVPEVWIVMVYLRHEWLWALADGVPAFPRGSCSINRRGLSLAWIVMRFGVMFYLRHSWCLSGIPRFAQGSCSINRRGLPLAWMVMRFVWHIWLARGCCNKNCLGLYLAWMVVRCVLYIWFCTGFQQYKSSWFISGMNGHEVWLVYLVLHGIPVV